jgi:hypothetical protein
MVMRYKLHVDAFKHSSTSNITVRTHFMENNFTIDQIVTNLPRGKLLELFSKELLASRKMINVHHMYNKSTTPLSHGVDPTHGGAHPM